GLRSRKRQCDHGGGGGVGGGVVRGAGGGVAAVVLVCAALFSTSRANAEDKVKIEIRVNVPKQTPPNSTLYLAGDLEAVGQWKADGVALKPAGDGVYSVQLDLPKGQTLEYKINRGNWETVEKDAKGDEIGNRTLSIDGEKT